MKGPLCSRMLAARLFAALLVVNGAGCALDFPEGEDVHEPPPVTDTVGRHADPERSAGAGDGGDASGIAASRSEVRWRSCPTERAPTLECATLTVPLAHDDPDEDRELDIDLARLPATAAGAARPLVLGPADPGARGTVLVESLAGLGTVPDALRERFDLVGFDRRGTGTDTRLDCEDLGYLDTAEMLDDRESIERFVHESAAAAARCAERHDGIVGHLGSNATVHDMDVIREALGVERLDFLGYSYGARLGALYLERFPERAGRVVLDASVAPSGGAERLALDQASGLERALDALLVDCGTRLSGCEPVALGAALERRADELLALGAHDEVVLLASWLSFALLEPTIGELAIAPLLDYVESGDVGVLIEFGALLETLGIDPEASLADGSATAARAVLCADDPARPDADALLELLSRLDARRICSPRSSCRWPASASAGRWHAIRSRRSRRERRRLRS